MSVRTKSIKKTVFSTVSIVADDDYLSISSEKTGDSITTKTSQNIINESGDNKKEQSFFNSIDVSTSENIFDEEENKSSRTLERSKTSTSWDSDKQMVIISTDSQSVSSIADQQIENQSSIATFYIINETDTRSNTFQQYVENDSDNQQISNVSNQFSDQQQSSAEMAFGEPYIHRSDIYGL